MGVPHFGQADPGRTIDSFRGTRWITTVRNEPKIRPARASRITVKRGTPESLRGSLRRPPVSQLTSRRAVDDLAQVRRLRVVPEQEESRGDDRDVVKRHVVGDVDLATDDLAVEPVGVVVPEVDGALAVHEHVEVV